MELLEFYRGKKVLVTGHTGFKGSWFVRMLTLAGAQVTGYGLKPPTQPSMFEITGLENTIDHVIGDIRDLGRLKGGFRPGTAGDSLSPGGSADCAGIL